MPYPANYGGVIDVYNKLIALHSMGIEVYLHCFSYGRKESKNLNKYCKKVFYYKRKTSVLSFFSTTPYIVKSRSSNLLLNRLNNDNFPILFEGIHSTSSFYSLFKNNSERKLFIRAHNIEHYYYNELFKLEANILKKIFFYYETKKLKKYEQKIFKNSKVFTISGSDFNLLKSYKFNTVLINPFHPNERISSLKGSSDYGLFHGNLEVADNELSAIFLINIFKKLDFKLVIAGRNPSQNLKNCINELSNINLIESPEDEQLFSLIKNAQVNLFYSFQSSGVKLKLINALFNGRFCYVNQNYLVNDNFINLCDQVINDSDWKEQIVKAFSRVFSKKDYLNREKELKVFENKYNVELLIKEIFI